jgi:hypothetical protein
VVGICAWDGSEDGAGGTREWDVGEVGGQAETGESPRPLQIRGAEPASRREVVIGLRGAVEKEGTVGVVGEGELCSGNAGIGGLSIKENDLGGRVAKENRGNNGIRDLRGRDHFFDVGEHAGVRKAVELIGQLRDLNPGPVERAGT